MIELTPAGVDALMAGLEWACGAVILWAAVPDLKLLWRRITKGKKQ